MYYIYTGYSSIYIIYIGKGAKRLQAVLDAPRRNASCEVDRFEVAQGMDPMCTQNPWAITVLLCTAVPGTAVAPFFSSTRE